MESDHRTATWRVAAVPIAGAAAGLLLLLAALGRGGEDGWAQGLVLAAGGVGFAALAAERRDIPRDLCRAALLWGLAVGGCLFQALPIEPLAHAMWAEAAAVLPQIGSGSIALDPHAATGDGVRLLAYAGIFALGFALAGTGCQRTVLALIAGAIAVLAGAAVLLVPDQAGYGLGKVRHAADAVFPFTSRNTFCAFAGAGLVVCASVLSAGNGRRLPVWLGLAAFCAAGVLASHSRAGLVATLVGCAAALLVTRPMRAAVPLALAGGAGLAVVSLFTLTGLRFAAIWEDLPVRLAIWEASAAIARDHFWLGLGSLDQALQIWPGDWGDRHITRAHNIYLQAVAERGFPIFLAIFVPIISVVYGVCRSSRRNIDPDANAVVGAAMGVFALFAAHGLVDFSLYAPINAAILALLLGLASGRKAPALPPQPGFATNAQPFQS